MGMVFWQFPYSVDLPSRHGRYLGDMSISRAESVRLVEQALTEGPAEGMTGKQVWEAIDRTVPEHTVRLMLGEMVHKGVGWCPGLLDSAIGHTDAPKSLARSDNGRRRPRQTSPSRLPTLGGRARA